MNGKQRSLRRWGEVVGFSLVAVLLNMLICADPAAAQCGVSGLGGGNTECGTGALESNTLGGLNSALGFDALTSNTTGYYNAASGVGALASNTGGNGNTASGYEALFSDTTGNDNTASGVDALFSDTTGNSNTASGDFALFSNTMGNGNTASGELALAINTTGGDNTANGVDSLYSNTTGWSNTANGIAALFSNTTSYYNTASGGNALYYNTTGYDNTASGYNALVNETTGSYNIGLGAGAGGNVVAGSNNIDIGGAGSSDESNTIRIGHNNTQSATYIAGISGTGVTGSTVEVTSSGQLGIALSSARYKRGIRDMGGASAGLMRLRPVTFRYKNDSSGTLQYGLVAEEVERVYPELVTRGPEGKVQSVRYLEFTALLLNELQKQAKGTRELAQRLEMKDRQLAAQQREIDALKQKDASINALSERLAALEQQVRTATPQGLRSLASK
jgi:trimeric autotransporter adhesin